jgi:RNA polymerase sigma factor (sigma-70 family)
MTSFEFNNNLIGMKQSLQRYAMSLTSDRESALDLVQDTYLKAITNKDKFVDYTNLKSWVFTIMKNTFINSYRHDVIKNSFLNFSQDIQYINAIHTRSYVSPESVFTEGEIEKAIDSLCDEFRIPFKMHIEGFKYWEIADIMHLKMGTVRSRIFFARQKLMRILHDQC